MSGGGYGQQQQWGQTGGNMYGRQMDGFGGGPGYSLTGGMTGGNMGAPTPSPMESAFAPDQMMPATAPVTGLPSSTGLMGSEMPPMRNPGFNPQNPWRGSLPGGGGWDAKPYGGVGVGLSPDMAQVGGNMGGAMAKVGGGIGLTGGGMTGGNMGAPGSYQDYMNRRNAWINELRGYVMPPQSIGGGWQSPVAPTPGSPAPPRGTPPPQAPRTPGSTPVEQKVGGPDHLANFRQLLAEDPSGRLASEYRLRNGDTIGWWQNQMQSGNAPGLLGGDQRLLDFMRNTSPVSSNSAPLTTAEMMRLNQMAGIRGPSWLK